MDRDGINQVEEVSKAISIANEEFVTARELNVVLEEVRLLRDQLVVIQFENAIKQIKLVFIAGLYLLYKDRGLRFKLPRLGIGEGDLFTNKSAFYELKHYLAHIDYLYGETNPIWIEAVEYHRSDVKASRVYSPTLYIDKDTLDCLFKGKEAPRFEELKTLFIHSLNKKANNDEIAFFAETHEDHILNRLFSHAPVYTFVYCILHLIDSPFVNNKEEDKLAEAIKRIDRIWSFTVKYVAGLYELAKNIVFHSNKQRGVISIRAYRSEGGKESDRIIETYVIDYGTEGIVPTMIREMQKECDIDLPSVADVTDLAILSDNYSLQKFFTPGKAERLSRQFRREMAHLGLLHFMALVHSYKGSSWISTASSGQPPRDTFGDVNLQDGELVEGTNFHFSLPLSRRFSDADGLVSPLPSITREAIASMPHIFELMDQIEIIRLNLNISYIGRSFIVADREAERIIIGAIPFEGQKGKFLVLDFDRIDFSPTSLLRVLAMVSERTDKSVIAMNIQTEVLSQMIESNEKYFETMDELERVPFWIRDRAILIYSKLEDNDFYFADILYGDSPEAFFSINKMVNNCFPNFATIASTISTKLSDDHFRKPAVTGFFSQSTLLPFDMILTDRDGMDLFSHNLQNLVNKKLI